MMKKTFITFSVASTLLVGGLAGCGANQEVQDAGRDRHMIGQNDQNNRGARVNNADNNDRQGLNIFDTNEDDTNNVGNNNNNNDTNDNDATGNGNNGGNGNNAANNEGEVDKAGNTAEDYKYEGKFDDVGGHWAAEEIEWAENLGLFIGRDEGVFAPEGTLTRAEAATLFKRLTDEGVLVFPEADEPAEGEQQDGNAEDPTEGEQQDGNAEDPTEGEQQDGDAQDPTEGEQQEGNAEDPTEAEQQAGEELEEAGEELQQAGEGEQQQSAPAQ